MSKASDYLALLKNFLVKFIIPKSFTKSNSSLNSYPECNSTSSKSEPYDIDTVLKEMIYFDEKRLVLQCNSSKCDCANLTMENCKDCNHKIKEYSITPHTGIFDKFKGKCAK
jgi:hypothetical protein